jgi:hypothetical protein
MVPEEMASENNLGKTVKEDMHSMQTPSLCVQRYGESK